jgi:phosphoribosylformylglycinamidine cyclo-ligase
MPGFYKQKEYDLAGFAVGIVDNNKIIDGSEIHVGHQVIGFASSGLHSNGYSLVRKICFDDLKLNIDSHVPDLGQTIGEELLTPTIIYSETIRHVIRDLPVHGLVHVTGGGIPGNLIRIIPQTCQAVLIRNSWDVPPIFPFLQEAGNISEREMMRTFNNGIGMIAVVPQRAAQDMLERLSATNEKAFVIGEIVERKASDSGIKWV